MQKTSYLRCYCICFLVVCGILAFVSDQLDTRDMNEGPFIHKDLSSQGGGSCFSLSDTHSCWQEKLNISAGFLCAYLGTSTIPTFQHLKWIKNLTLCGSATFKLAGILHTKCIFYDHKHEILTYILMPWQHM